ncbi:unnamed protein product [Paramecium octaurelia]|uniref:Uncharacterized protein n=1 Tax=Paramecium octaurelia TaxID=43137 RepID=A0A8S1WIL3_PAROT|nr:unnamed protein product [Paramecium octaurelia]
MLDRQLTKLKIVSQKNCGQLVHFLRTWLLKKNPKIKFFQLIEQFLEQSMVEFMKPIQSNYLNCIVSIMKKNKIVIIWNTPKISSDIVTRINFDRKIMAQFGILGQCVYSMTHI